MKLKNLLVTVFAPLLSQIASASTPTDYFQSATSGNWSTIATWESSPTATGPWVASTLVPTSASQGIFIRNGTTVTLDVAATASTLTVDSGGMLIHLSGISFTVYDGPSVFDFTVNGTYELNGTAPTFDGAATASIANSGVVSVTDDTGGQSDNFAFDSHVYFNSGLFDWAIPLAFQTSGITYFPNATASDHARFRIDANVANVGSNNPTTINGIFEVGAGYAITWQNAGEKTFRDGFSGQGGVTQASNSGPFVINSPSAGIDGSVHITLQKPTSNALEITDGGNVTISGSPTITVGTSTFPATLFIGNIAGTNGGTLIHNGSIPIDISHGSLVLQGSDDTHRAVLGGTGTFTGSPIASVEAIHFATASLTMTPRVSVEDSSNYLRTLSIGNGSVVTTGDSLNITAGTDYGTVTVAAGGTLHCAHILTFKSDAYGTARIATGSGTIDGNVVVERFIPARKCWRLLSRPPFSDSTQSINAAWQEGVSNTTTNCALNGGTPGYGTILFNGGASPWPGYDYTHAVASNIKTFATGGQSFLVPPSTTGIPIARWQGYFVFIYGDRQICLGGPVTATSTTLRSRGVPNTGTVTLTFAGLTPGDYFMVCNPYVSSVDLANVVTSATGIANAFWVWDAEAYGAYGYGEYVLVSGNTIIPAEGTTNFPDASSAHILQSGQAFIVQATSTTATITFNESDKTTNQSSKVFGRVVPSVNVSLASAAAGAKSFDGVAIHLSDESDVFKSASTSNRMNLFLEDSGSLVAIQSQAVNPFRADTFALELRSLSAKTYTLIFSHQEHLRRYNVTLVDRYLRRDTVVTEGLEYAFAVTGDSGSYTHRFLLVVDGKVRHLPDSSATPVEGVRIYPNPVHDVINFSEGISTQSATIVDASGIVWMEIGATTGSIDVSSLKKGMYVLKLKGQHIALPFIKL